MTELNRRELDEYLAELSAVVNSYKPINNRINAAVIVAIIAICLIVIYEVGIVFGILLLALGSLPIIYMASNSSCSVKTEKELSERACILMNRCVNLYKYPGDDSVTYYHRTILSYRTDGNLALYREFITRCPYMASKKLQKLASIKLRG